MAVEKFTIQTPDAVLADLAHRLEATRWPDELEGSGWEFAQAWAMFDRWLTIGVMAMTGGARQQL